MADLFDFNDAGPQRSSDVIPDGTLVVVQLGINPGGIGPGSWEKRAADGNSDGLDCEFVVIEPQEHAKRKIFQRMTLRGATAGHTEAGRITRDLLRAILEAARGIQPNDTSEAAQAARKITGWGDLDGLRFPVTLGVRPPSNGYAAKNVIREVITPDKQAWRKITQVPKTAQAQSNNASSTATPPAGSVTRPDWAG
jgi:hypothetical protein